jgi:hypothetical protein
MQPTITKVDPQAATVTVKMEDKEGKEVEKTFHLMEDAEYLDSTGRVATIDVFQSGDEILFVEMEGNIKEMKKHPQTKSVAEKTTAPGNKAKMPSDKAKKSGDKTKAPTAKKRGGHKAH